MKATVHPDKRTDVPTADAQDFVAPETNAPTQLPDTGKVVVKVINDYGDEVMQVFEVAR